MNDLKAVLFDKDGTLIDYTLTWGAYTKAFLSYLAPDDLDIRSAIAKAIGYNEHKGDFVQGSVAVNGTFDGIIKAIQTVLPEFTKEDALVLDEKALHHQDLVELCDLRDLFARIKAAGMLIGIVTNDFEASTFRQMEDLGLREEFDWILAADSGFTPKPAGDMIKGFCEKFELDPSQVVMVGDSTHDLNAGRNAGVGLNVAVLTGPAKEHDLTHLADLVLGNVSELPAKII